MTDNVKLEDEKVTNTEQDIEEENLTIDQESNESQQEDEKTQTSETKIEEETSKKKEDNESNINLLDKIQNNHKGTQDQYTKALEKKVNSLQGDISILKEFFNKAQEKELSVAKKEIEDKINAMPSSVKAQYDSLSELISDTTDTKVLLQKQASLINKLKSEYKANSNSDTKRIRSVQSQSVDHQASNLKLDKLSKILHKKPEEIKAQCGNDLNSLMFHQLCYRYKIK